MIINKKFLKEYSPLSLNMNLDEIMNYVPVSEQIWIIPTIGQQLYDQIEEQVENNTLSEENATLLTDGLLWQYEAYCVCLEALPFIWAHISEVGLTRGKSENADSIDLKDLTYIQNHLRSQVEYLKSAVIKWLCERYDTFPLFDNEQCDCCKSCCNKDGALKKPNPYLEVYSTLRKCTDIK